METLKMVTPVQSLHSMKSKILIKIVTSIPVKILGYLHLPLNQKQTIILNRFPLILILSSTSLRLFCQLSAPFHPVADLEVKPEFRNNLNTKISISEVVPSQYHKKLTCKGWIRFINFLNSLFEKLTPKNWIRFIWALASILGFWILLILSFWILLIYFPANFNILFLQRSTLQRSTMEENKGRSFERMQKLVTMGRGGPRKPTNWWDRFKANWKRKLQKTKKAWAQKLQKIKEVLQRQYFYEQKIWESLFNDPRDV